VARKHPIPNFIDRLVARIGAASEVLLSDDREPLRVGHLYEHEAIDGADAQSKRLPVRLENISHSTNPSESAVPRATTRSGCRS
jgi:hypothetical protein